MTSGKFVTTLGYERRFNPAFQFDHREAFIAFMTAGQPSRPANVGKIIAINQGRQPLTRSLDPLPALSPQDFEAQVQEGAAIVDIRDSAEFGAGHIPGAFNIQLSSPEFEQRLGWMLPGDNELLLVGQADGDADRAQRAAAFIGLERRLNGYLAGGMGAWRAAGKSVAQLPQIAVEQLQQALDGGELAVLDVRSRDEWDEGHIQDAVHLHYREIAENVQQLGLAPDQPLAVTCASGYRSSIAASILLQHGFRELFNVTGGMDAWKAAGLPRVDAKGT